MNLKELFESFTTDVVNNTNREETKKTLTCLDKESSIQYVKDFLKKIGCKDANHEITSRGSFLFTLVKTMNNEDLPNLMCIAFNIGNTSVTYPVQIMFKDDYTFNFIITEESTETFESSIKNLEDCCNRIKKMHREYYDKLYSTQMSESFTSKVIDDKKSVDKKEQTKDLFNYVNLGLPSGTLWCRCNYGADKDTDPGEYMSYDIAKMIKDNDILPGKNDFLELFVNTDHKFTKKEDRYGMLFTSKINGQSIFFPAAGMLTRRAGADIDKQGHYWSSDVANNDGTSAYNMNFRQNAIYPNSYNSTFFKFSVRLIKNNRIDESFISKVVDDKQNIDKKKYTQGLTITPEYIENYIKGKYKDLTNEFYTSPLMRDGEDTIFGYNILWRFSLDKVVKMSNKRSYLENGECFYALYVKYAMTEEGNFMNVFYVESEKPESNSFATTKFNLFRSKKFPSIGNNNCTEGDFEKMSKVYQLIKGVHDSSWLKDFGQTYSNDIFLINSEDIIPYIEKCLKTYTKLIDLKKSEIKTYEEVDKLFEKKNITIKQ